MPYEVQLNPHEARLFGVLIEKALTTPDQYPLTLNAATNGANQKSNRDPVLSLEETEVERALDGLEQKHLARRVFPENSRAEKFTHRGGEMLGLPQGSLAVLAELLMRGPQAPGELRARAARMSPIESLQALAESLQPLQDRGYIRRLPPAPGTRAERYVQLLCPDLHGIERASAGDAGASAVSASGGGELAERLASLEAEIERLRRHVAALAERVGYPLD